jgi:RNA polymerase sigma-70 factor (ECF subfamily)
MAVKNKKIFSQAYNDYAPQVYKHIYFRVGNRHLAEDIAQETFLKTWKYIVSGRKKIENLKEFLYIVANHLIVDHYRSKYRGVVPIENAYNEPAMIVGPRQIDRVEAIIKMGAINQHLRGLKKNCREIIHYRYVEDLSIKEIGRLTNKSPNHISVILHRGLKNIRQKMGLL